MLLVSGEPASCQGNYITAKVSALTSYSKNADLLGTITLTDLILPPFVHTSVGCDLSPFISSQGK